MSASPKRRSTSGPTVDIVRESSLWDDQPEIDSALGRAIAEAAVTQSTKAGELAIVLTDDSKIRALNRIWRGMDKPTNVLSFPTRNAGGKDAAALLGDIVIAYETAAREARDQAIPFLHHVAHLAVHGYLHLCGYDHETDDEAESMERLERAILARLDIADPYVARDGAAD